MVLPYYSIIILPLRGSPFFPEFFKILKCYEDLELESVIVKAGEGITERYDIKTLGNKIPHQILATVESGSWIFNLPTTAIVYLEPDDKADNIIEYWDVAFANTKKGKIVFYRTIVNNDVIDRDSYAWNLKIKCKLIRYK